MYVDVHRCTYAKTDLPTMQVDVCMSLYTYAHPRECTRRLSSESATVKLKGLNRNPEQNLHPNVPVNVREAWLVSLLASHRKGFSKL